VVVQCDTIKKVVLLELSLMSHLLRPLIFSLLCLLLGACSLTEEDETKGWSQQRLFDEATSEMRAGNYESAIKYYEKLESRYPFGKYAHQAQLNTAYAHYRNEEPESALAAADRFIKFHPQHPAEAYAHYLKGLVNFNRNQGLLARYIPIDKSQRDPGAALDSYEDFKVVLERFPESEYAEDARRRMLHLRNNLARHEVHVARYYIKRGAYIAAANRAAYAITHYPRSPSIKSALEILVEAYTELGIPELADDAQRVLAANEGTPALIADPQEFEDETLGGRLWKFFDLDQD